MRRVLLLAALFWSGLLLAGSAPGPGDVPPNVIGKESRSGEDIHIDAQAGKVVVLSFWASWCGPCRQELPVLEALQRRVAPDRLRVIAVNYQEEPDVYVQHLERMREMKLSMVHDPDGALADAYGVDGLPQMFLIDHRGRVAHVHQGYEPDALPQIVSEINALLTAQARARRAGAARVAAQN